MTKKQLSPYLVPDRLSDIVAAIQFMASYERSTLPCKQWAFLISGTEDKTDRWRMVFNQHPEFFRPSPNHQDNYALIWRRALNRLYCRVESRMLTREEFEALPAERQSWVSRPTVPIDQVQTLIDVAIDLHAKAVDQSRDRRWWIPVVASFIGSLLGALLALAAAGGAAG